MTGRVPVAFTSCILQREVDHRPAQQGGRQWVFGFQRIRRRPEDLVVIAVEFICSRQNQFRGVIHCRPGYEKGAAQAMFEEQVGWAVEVGRNCSSLVSRSVSTKHVLV